MRAQNCDCKVLAHREVTAGIRLLQVEWTDREHAPRAGQFYMLRCWRSDEAPLLSRPISVHEWDAEAGVVTFLYEVRGEGTRKLSALRPGDALNLTGPAGNGWPVDQLLGKKVALVGGGIGTAPLLQLAKELAAAGEKPAMFCGFRDEPYRLDAFEPYCSGVAVATDSGRFGHHGLVTALYNSADYDVICCCGPTPMMKAATGLALEAGAEILVSLENKMACGIGACLGCTCHSRKKGAISVCKQGPVLKGEDVYG